MFKKFKEFIFVAAEREMQARGYRDEEDKNL